MLNDLKFVAGAIARKDFVPALQYFKIEDGRIYAYNGSMAISTPTDLDVKLMPKAIPLVKAIEKIPDDTAVTLNLTDAGRLSVKAGRFRCYIECHADEQAFPNLSPQGEYIALPGGILPVLRVMSPFMGIDASRPWALGILFDGQSAFATNNIVLIQHWLPHAMPGRFTIPSDAIKELLRVGREPVGMTLGKASVTFHYENSSWIRTQLSDGEWPDLTRVLDRPHQATAFPDGFFDAVDRLKAFTDKSNHLHIRGGTLATSAHEGDGAAVDLDDFGGQGKFFLTEVAKLSGVASKIDWTHFPDPCLFFGDKLRGAMIGMRA